MLSSTTRSRAAQVLRRDARAAAGATTPGFLRHEVLGPRLVSRLRPLQGGHADRGGDRGWGQERRRGAFFGDVRLHAWERGVRGRRHAVVSPLIGMEVQVSGCQSKSVFFILRFEAYVHMCVPRASARVQHGKHQVGECRRTWVFSPVLRFTLDRGCMIPPHACTYIYLQV